MPARAVKLPAPTQLLALKATGALISACVVGRPSARNRSPYVMDVRLDDDGRIAIAHAPCMDMGGKCAPGVAVLLRRAIDSKGVPISADAVSPKYGTPKCEFVTHLLRCAEPEHAALRELSGGGDGCWVAAHPDLGEQVAAALLDNGELAAALGQPISLVRKQVTVIEGSRADFWLEHGGGDGEGEGGVPATVLEVKMVIDTDYDRALDAERPPPSPAKQPLPRFYAPDEPAAGPAAYRRCALFPWGRAAQKGPDGEKVVSARAIKHLDELAALATGEARALPDGRRVGAALLFVVARADVYAFRPNVASCPSFAAHLRAARDAGVRVLAWRVRFEDDGTAVSLGALPIDWDSWRQVET